MKVVFSFNHAALAWMKTGRLHLFLKGEKMFDFILKAIEQSVNLRMAHLPRLNPKNVEPWTKTDDYEAMANFCTELAYAIRNLSISSYATTAEQETIDKLKSMEVEFCKKASEASLDM